MNTKIMITAILMAFAASHSTFAVSPSEKLVVVEQENGTVSSYEATTGRLLGTVRVELNPHEVAINQESTRAYVTNFGVQDYDHTIGIPGLSISVIDLSNMRELHKLYVYEEGENPEQANKGPHGVRLRPPFESLLYVNVEFSDEMLVFDISTRKIVNRFPVTKGTHNFVFSKDGSTLYLMAGKAGVVKVNPENGSVIDSHMSSTPARGLSLLGTSNNLIVSGVGEITIVNGDTMEEITKFSNLGVGQILYSSSTPDGSLIVSPAVWDQKILIIDTKSGKIIKTLESGEDPVSAIVSKDGKRAYVSNAKSDFVSVIYLEQFTQSKLKTNIGPNGLGLAQ